MQKPLNCWEFKKCGRGPEAEQSGGDICPAATEGSLDGIHRGDKAGRSCWAVAGTFYAGEPSCDFAIETGSCEECDFYAQVVADETGTLQDNADLQLILGAVSR